MLSPVTIADQLLAVDPAKADFPNERSVAGLDYSLACWRATIIWALVKAMPLRHAPPYIGFFISMRTPWIVFSEALKTRPAG